MVEAILSVVALYCGGMWLVCLAQVLKHGAALSDFDRGEIEQHSFHLGLCFILALGFLGLIGG